MDFIKKNFKRGGLFNIILIILAFALCVVKFILPSANALVTINDAIFAIAIIFGLIYSFGGYKKELANFYNAFLIAYALGNTCTIISDIILSKGDIQAVIFPAILRIIITGCASALAYIKDFGKKNSTIVTYILILLETLMFVGTIVVSYTNLYEVIRITLYLVLALLVCIFVFAKYDDKEARGSK